jgi:hypothetical protein
VIEAIANRDRLHRGTDSNSNVWPLGRSLLTANVSAASTWPDSCTAQLRHHLLGVTKVSQGFHDAASRCPLQRCSR